MPFHSTVIPAQAGIQSINAPSRRLRRFHAIF